MRLSPAAKQQLEALTRFYLERNRDIAVDRLADAVEQAGRRFIADQGLFYDAPRPYPAATRPGWRWTKEGRYWIAFSRSDPDVVIVAIFHDSADIPGRL